MPVLISTLRLQIVRQCDLPGEDLAAYHLQNQAFHAPWSPLRTPDWYEPEQMAARALGENPDLKFALCQGEKIIGLVTVTGLQGGPFRAAYLGFSLDEAAQGQGLMFEALSTLIPHIFAQPVFGEQPLHRLMAAHMPANHRSARLLNRLGFEREGLARSYLEIAGKWEDHVLTSFITSRCVPHPSADVTARH